MSSISLDYIHTKKRFSSDLFAVIVSDISILTTFTSEIPQNVDNDKKRNKKATEKKSDNTKPANQEHGFDDATTRTSKNRTIIDITTSESLTNQ